MKLTITPEHEIGSVVYLKTDIDQLPRMVIGYCIRPNNLLVYDVQCGTQVSSHYNFEMSTEIDILKNTTN